MNYHKLYRIIIFPVIILFILSSYWTFLLVRPELSQPVSELTIKVIPNYQVISEKNVIAWPEGTIFEQGMAAYFYATEPNVRVSPTIEVIGLDQGKLEGTIKTGVYLRAVNDKSQIFWSYTVVRPKEEEFLFAPDDQLKNELTYAASDVILDVVSAYKQANLVGEELMLYTGILQLIVISEIELNGEVNTVKVNRSIEQVLPIELYQSSFSIPEPKEVHAEINVDLVIDNALEKTGLFAGIRRNLLPVIITLLLGLTLLIILLTANILKPKSAAEHRRFKEWITEGRVEVKDKLIIQIVNLEGLVDIAIDLDRRVIYDVKSHKYYVLTEDIAYMYEYSHKDYEKNKSQLGKLLLEQRLISAEQLETGLYYQQKIGTRLGESLVALGFIDETTLYSVLAAQHGTDYYELNPSDINKLDWLEKMSIKEATAFLALPLGTRSDGKIVIACGDISRESIIEALREKFGKEAHLVAVRPSKVYETLKLFNEIAKEKAGLIPARLPKQAAPYEQLSIREGEEFVEGFYRGKFRYDLFLKAAAMTDSDILLQKPEKEPVIGWLVSKNFISADFANLVKGLDKLTQAMDWKKRQEKHIPSILELLQEANYLTLETIDWINQEHNIQGIKVTELLQNNCLASNETIRNATFLLAIMNSILNKMPVRE